jgi:cystathionine gamma-lyase
VVVHSTTKFINGHSDVLGGVLVTSDVALAQQLGFIQNAVGAVPSPFDCYLTLRGIKTLPVRMARHCDNAEAIAGFLSQHPQVEQVHFPGLPSHPQHALAQAQMARPGAVLSVVLRADQAGTRRFLSALRLFSLAESLGGCREPGVLPAADEPRRAAARAALAAGHHGLVRAHLGRPRAPGRPHG